MTVTPRPTRAERREARRIERKAVELQELARASAGPAAFTFQKSVGPGALPVTVLQTAEERKSNQQEERDKIRGTGALSTGRPPEYTADEADAICAWMAEGGSLRSYTRQAGRGMQTIYKWMRENADFQARYIRACEDRADTLGDDIIQIADDAAINPSIEGVAAAKLQVEARKWIAAKLRPNKWGDKQIVEHKGSVSIRLGIPARTAPTVENDVADAKVIER